MNKKYVSLSTTNLYVSKGKFQQNAGKMDLGASRDSNYSYKIGSGNTGSGNIVAVGSAYTQGNQVRSMYDLNSNGEFLYNFTPLDSANVKSQFPNTFLLYPTLNDFPYLYPISQLWDAQSVSDTSKEFPIYRYSGKGVGDINFRNNGSIKTGQVSRGYPENMDFYKGYANVWHTNVGDIPIQPSTRNVNGAIYPYSGAMYSGNIVQLDFETESSSQPYANVKVIPYQSGRGIPQYDPLQEYFGGQPFGIPKWPNTDLQMEPCLSWGSNSGCNDFCAGVVLDTETSKPRIYNTPVPEYYTREELESSKFVKWYNHPAPFTAPPENVSFTRTPRVLSPGPGLSDTYWAPWPKFYAYQQREETPVLQTGTSSLKIGAAYNIGMQAYYEPDVEDGDDPINNPKYVSVSCVPLFQGEKVKIGSEVYANAMGHVLTYDQKGFDPYPLGSYINVCGMWGSVEYRDSRMTNPWYDWWDPTFGATGWTSTPAFLLSGIPDEGVAIIETKNGQDLPFMSQSNQGSVIVHAVTTINPQDPENGSGRMRLLGPPDYYSVENNIKFSSATKQPAFGGRALTVGNTLQEIEGTGRWAYSGALDLPQSVFVNGWGTPYLSSDLYSTSPITGTGQGMVVVAGATVPGGPITSYSIFSEGTGYADGDIIRLEFLYALVDFPGYDITYSKDSYRNLIYSACFVYDSAGPSLTPHLTGTGYRSESGLQTFNLTKNNLVVSVTGSPVFTIGEGIDSVGDVSIVFNPIPSKYPPGTRILIETNSFSSLDEAVLVVDTNDGTNLAFVFGTYNTNDASNFSLKGGATMYGNDVTKIYNTRIINQKDPVVTIIASDGEVTDVLITDMGTGNSNGDLILVQQKNSGNNFIFELNTVAGSVVMELVKGGVRYPWYQYATNYTYNSPELYNNLTVLNPGGTLTNGLVTMNFASPDNGSIKNIRTNVLNLSPQFNGVFGNVNTLGIKLPWNYSDGGKESIVNNNTATFLQECYFVIDTPGTGYTVGANYGVVSGGAGVGMIVDIIEVGSLGQIIKLILSNIGVGYVPGDTINLIGGNNDSLIRLEFYPSETIGIQTVLTNLGLGYTVGGPFNVSSSGIGTGMTVNVLEVSSVGAISKIEIDSQGINYSDNDIQTILSGNFAAIFLVFSQPKVYNSITSGGTGYSTATDVETFNVTLNNMYPLCDMLSVPGQCTVIDITAGNERPEWDFSRYSVGDVLEFIEESSGSSNTTSTAEILTIGDGGTMTFSQLTPGIAYSTQAAETYVQSNNTSLTPTTVDITTDSNGFVINVVIRTAGDRLKYGDYLVIKQPLSDNNCVVRYSAEKDVPPAFQPFVNYRVATSSEWNAYKDTMKSAVNLLDTQIITELYPTYPNYMNESWNYYGDGGIKNDPNIQFSLCAIL